MNNPFRDILTLSSAAGGPKKSSPPKIGGSGPTKGERKPVPTKLATAVKASKKPATKPASPLSTTPSSLQLRKPPKQQNNKLNEIKAALSKLEGLTGGRLSSKDLFAKFVSASREAAASSAADANYCVGQEQENKNPKPNAATAATVSRAATDATSDVEDESNDVFSDFAFSPEPAAANSQKQQQRPSRYSLGVSRFSLPHPGRLSIDTRRMSLSELGKGGLSPRRVMSSLRAEAAAPSSSSAATDDQGEAFSVEGNFLEFCCVGVDRAILSGFEPCRRSLLQPPQIIDVFPTRDPACPAPIIETIADYCFPEGVRLELVSGQTDIDRVAQAPPPDTLHVLQFSDANGKPTYGAVLIVTELLEAPNDLTVESLQELSDLKRAAAVLQRFFSRVLSGSLSRPPPANFAGKTPSRQGPSASSSSTLVNRMVAWSARKGLHNQTQQTPARVAATPSAVSSLFHRFGATQPKTERSAEAPPPGTLLGATLPTPERLMYNPLGLAQFFSDENDSGCESEDDSSEGSDHSEDVKGRRSRVGRADHLREPVLDPPLRPRRATAGGTVEAAPAEKHAVLTQRAYCLLATKPLHSLLFKVLEAVAHRERATKLGSRAGAGVGERTGFIPLSATGSSSSLLRASALLSLQVREFSRQRSASAASAGASSTTAATAAAAARNRSESASSTASSSSNASRGSQGTILGAGGAGAGGIIADALFFSRKARRDRFLQQMQCLPLAVDAADGIISVDVSSPSYIKTFRFESRTTELAEWTTAALFSTLPAPVVLQVLSLLLLEKSLIVCGSDMGLVSAIGSAFTQLLRPFSWQGCFVPILPNCALEVLEAPVPFIMGVVATAGLPSLSSVSNSAAVLFLDDFLNAGTTTASRPHRRQAHRRRFLLVPTDDSSAALADPSRSSDLGALAREVEPLAAQLRLGKRSAPSSRSASMQLVSFMLGLTPLEKRVVQALLATVERHNQRLLGPDLLERGGWRKFGLFNDSNKSWEFYPELLIEPLKARLAFQEGVVHTQLFVSYLDGRKAAEEEESSSGGGTKSSRNAVIVI